MTTPVLGAHSHRRGRSCPGRNGTMHLQGFIAQNSTGSLHCALGHGVLTMAVAGRGRSGPSKVLAAKPENSSCLGYQRQPNSNRPRNRSSARIPSVSGRPILRTDQPEQIISHKKVRWCMDTAQGRGTWIRNRTIYR